MKHIKKKYLFEDKLKDINFDSNKDSQVLGIHEVNNDILKKASKSSNVILETTSDEKIFAFIYNNNGKHITILILP